MAQRAPLEAVTRNRIPPHNLDAEQSVLGAMMESKDAIANVSQILKSRDFYKPAHGQIFEVILELDQRGEPADAITVADELARQGILDAIGGKPYLTGLLDAYPTASSASRYARIIAEHAILRRLIEAGVGVQEIGFAMPDDISEAVDQAEQLIYDVGDRQLRTEVQPVRELLGMALEDLEARFTDGTTIRGTSTGFPDLDDLTLGFQPAQLIIVAARPSMGKCQSLTSLVDDPKTGERVTIQEFVERRHPTVLGVGGNGSIRATAVTDWIPNGARECLRLVTHTGRKNEATSNHPFLTVEGWKPLAELRVGDRIAVARRVEVFGDGCGWTETRARLLAYFIAEGRLTGSSPAFNDADHEIVSDFVGALRSEFPGCSFRRAGTSLRIAAKARSNRPNDVTRWLRELGLMGKKAEDKRFPAAVWRFTKPLLAQFLRALFTCYGTIYSFEDSARIEFAVDSEGLAGDVRHALTRFGVVASLTRKTERCWQVEITHRESVDIYQREIGWMGEKAKRRFESFPRYTDNAGVPRDVWSLVEKVAAQRGMSLAELARRAGESWSNAHTSRDVPQPRLARYAEILDSDDLRWMANPDLYWDEVVAIEPAGVHPVYDLTVPDGSNFIADDVCVHNSSLLNDFALSAALKGGKGVLIFSLEMGRQELVERFLASEARVDSQKLRKGMLQDADWQRLSAAIGRLAEAPIFIDDSPNVSLMEMRAKCRRLKGRANLGLVIVDYLQLMQSQRRSENRQQEVSEISRGLKILARELDVPVVCASQLNRGVEFRSDKRPMLGDLRESGCLTGETLVALADGTAARLDALVGDTPRVVALDGASFSPVRATKVWRTGHRPVLRITTVGGRKVRATANHKFRVLEGWKPLGQLCPGDLVAVSRPPALAPAATGGGRVSVVAGGPAKTALLDRRSGHQPAEAEVRWDTVASIEPDGEADVYDMTVPGPHNFVANGVVVHNSIEQDSDMVMFIYRDEVYNPDTEAKGEAELILAKHRNGPTGTIRLAFMNQYTKFASIARGPSF